MPKKTVKIPGLKKAEDKLEELIDQEEEETHAAKPVVKDFGEEDVIAKEPIEKEKVSEKDIFKLAKSILICCAIIYIVIAFCRILLTDKNGITDKGVIDVWEYTKVLFKFYNFSCFRPLLRAANKEIDFAFLLATIKYTKRCNPRGLRLFCDINAYLLKNLPFKSFSITSS